MTIIGTVLASIVAGGKALTVAGASALTLAAALHAGTASATPTDAPSIALSQHTGGRIEHCESQATEIDPAGCAGIDLLGGAPLAPGASHTSVVVVRNSGHSSLGSLELTAAPCTSRAVRLCSLLHLRITESPTARGTQTTLVDLPLEGLHTRALHLIAPGSPGQTRTVRFTVTLDRRTPMHLLGASVATPVSWQAAH
ncbi:hypothetical protein [uncultured Jatrophihabitans sp.]|uniref:hypothetical protein n=1 Tax=uncultured Jatrophihabitans sp. TaxID=1610747 RepID=UPI0035CAE13E